VTFKDKKNLTAMRNPMHVSNVEKTDFSSSSYLKTHEGIHTGEKPFACKQCGKALSLSMSHKILERNHTGGKTYVCKQYRKSFFVIFLFFIYHMCMHCLGHLSPLPSCPLSLLSTPSLPSRIYSAFFPNFVEEKT
jgi:hypothetical protein